VNVPGVCSAIPDNDLSARATAWLDTVVPEVAATVAEAPRSTILPPDSLASGERALAALAELSRQPAALSPGAVIGEGGMGVIREAEQVSLGRTVAVKTLKATRREPAATLGLLREAWVTGALEHPNIVPVHFLELDDRGDPVIVLKRISGVEWSKLLGDATAVEAKFGATDLLAWNLEILMQVLNAVRFAHARGVVHRDLKPSNVMVGDFGEVYLLDWGIAVSLRDDGSGRMALAANATEIAGTPCYMAPEMLGREGSAPISERTDVYLAGSVLFELIAKRPPHDGTSAAAVIASVIASAPQLPDAPPELAGICTRAMQADPAARYASADEMRLALQRYLAHRGSASLAARAAARLDELLAILAAPLPSTHEDSAAEREAAYRLFGACRFGCHEALAVWGDNAEARVCLARATIAVAEYELAAGNPKAAVTLLGELADAPPELVARAREAADAEVRRLAALEELRAQHDPTLGRRTRSLLAALLGGTFSLLPLLDALVPGLLPLQTHAGNTLWAAGAFAVVASIVWWARHTMGATQFNRSVAVTGLFLFLGQITLCLGAWAAGLQVAQSQVVMLFYWGTITAMVAITLDHWLAPAAILYFLGFLLAARIPECRLYVISAANLAFGINAVLRWRPATLKLSPEERSWLARQRVKTTR
jgi:serine/threonine-protein kinase